MLLFGTTTWFWILFPCRIPEKQFEKKNVGGFAVAEYKKLPKTKKKGKGKMKRTMFLKAKNSFVGRTLRRLLGEEKGAIMMEYVILGLLIAALAVVAVASFGSTLTDMFGTLSIAVTGDHRTAQEQQNQTQTNTQTSVAAAREHANNIHSAKSGVDVGTDQW